MARLRLGLYDRNLAAKTISPALRAFLAGQILFASRFSTLLRPLRGAASPSPAGRITTRTHWRDLVQPERRNHHGQHRHLHRRQRRLHRHARTLTLNVKVKLVPNDKGDNESAPDYRLQAAGHDIGAAWKKTSEAGRPYVSVTLDDPSFPATVYARLIEGEDGSHDLIWSRSKPKAA